MYTYIHTCGLRDISYSTYSIVPHEAKRNEELPFPVALRTHNLHVPSLRFLFLASPLRLRFPRHPVLTMYVDPFDGGLHVTLLLNRAQGPRGPISRAWKLNLQVLPNLAFGVSLVGASPFIPCFKFPGEGEE